MTWLDDTSVPADPPGAPDGPGPSTDPVCEVCGAPASLTPTGRVPKHPRCDEHKSSTRSSGGTSRGAVSSKAVNDACNNLDQLYTALVIPLALMHPDAGQAWVNQIDGLNTRNRALLANNPALVKKINSVGERGGNIAFMVSHVVAIAPVALVLVGRARANAEARQAEADAQTAAWAQDVPAEDFAFTGTPPGGVGPAFFDPEAS